MNLNEKFLNNRMLEILVFSHLIVGWDRSEVRWL